MQNSVLYGRIYYLLAIASVVFLIMNRDVEMHHPCQWSTLRQTIVWRYGRITSFTTYALDTNHTMERFTREASKVTNATVGRSLTWIIFPHSVIYWDWSNDLFITCRVIPVLFELDETKRYERFWSVWLLSFHVDWSGLRTCLIMGGLKEIGGD